MTLRLALGSSLRSPSQAIKLGSLHEAASGSIGATGAGLGRRYRNN